MLRDIEDPTLQGLSPEEKRYTLSGKLSEDADLQLKTPKLMYTQEMWTSEVERSLQPLDLPTYNQIVGYVTDTKGFLISFETGPRFMLRQSINEILKLKVQMESLSMPHLIITH